MNEFIAEITPEILLALTSIFVAIIGWIGRAITKYFKDKGITEKIREKPHIADALVHAAKDIFGDNQGEAKRAYGIDGFIKRMNDLGLPVTHEDANMFIRAAYQRMKDEATKSGTVIVEDMPAPDQNIENKNQEEK